MYQKLLWTISNIVDDKTTLENLSDVAFLDETHLIVADSDAHCMHIFDIEGNLCSTFAKHKVWPNCVAVTPRGHIIITDRKKRAVHVYDQRGTCINAWADELWNGENEVLLRPHGVCVNSKQQIFVSDTVLNTIKVYSPDGGDPIYQFSSKGRQVGQLCLPFYLATDKKDNIVISDNMNYCVKVFDDKGNYKFKIGSGTEWGKRAFKCPYGVAVDFEENIFIADNLGGKIPNHDDNGNIPMYDDNGDFITDFITKKNCINPCGVATNSSGYLAFTDNSLSSISLHLYKYNY